MMRYLFFIAAGAHSLVVVLARGYSIDLPFDIRSLSFWTMVASALLGSTLIEHHWRQYPDDTAKKREKRSRSAFAWIAWLIVFPVSLTAYFTAGSYRHATIIAESTQLLSFIACAIYFEYLTAILRSTSGSLPLSDSST